MWRNDMLMSIMVGDTSRRSDLVAHGRKLEIRRDSNPALLMSAVLGIAVVIKEKIKNGQWEEIYIMDHGLRIETSIVVL